MSLPRYAEYKESGISWIGEVPSHWIKRSLQDTARSGRNAFVDGPFGSDLKSEEYADEGIPLIQLNNVSVGKHDLTNLKFIPEKKAEELARHKATPGDIVIAKMAAPVARAAIVSSDFEQFVIVADCVKLSVEASRWNAKFLQYWINSAGVNAVAETLSAGITRLRINLGSLKKLPVFLTPLSEQTAIATFLDRETGKIDDLIAKQEKLLTLLAEKRQATISHAVTKGLNPDAPMKDSGVAWLGDVPEHWIVVRMKRVIREGIAGPYGSSLTKSMYTTSGYRVYGQQQVIPNDFSVGDYYISEEKFSEMSRYLVKPDDILISVMGTIGRAALVPQDVEPGIINPRLVLYRAREEVIAPRYLQVFINNPTSQKYFSLAAQGTTMEGLNMVSIGELQISLPTLDEQREILEFINAETERLDALRSESERAIALLKERRSALIAAAVTGQIDVRGLVTEPEAA